MPAAILKAHYDGKHIVLDEPFKLSVNAPLLVTVVAPEVERAEWGALAAQGLGGAFGANEPDYSPADLKPQ